MYIMDIMTSLLASLIQSFILCHDGFGKLKSFAADFGFYSE